MKLSQYIYGRKPKAGLQVITRSRTLPFYNKAWFDAPRYGAAPLRSTPDRIWTQRYELHFFKEGAVLSCLYPLKQTEIPCCEQQEPYIRGITPAVQHLLVGSEDLDEVIKNIDSVLHFDGFCDIDDIYRLPSTFAEPIDFTPAQTTENSLTDWECDMCVDMASCLWQAFMAFKDGKTGELSQRAVKLIVPAGTPEEELENQRRLLGYVLMLLPPYIRRWTSVTLNMEVESDAYPSGSAFYSMVRANPDSQLGQKNYVFDAEKQVWPAVSGEERAYFQARRLKTPIVELDSLIDKLPSKYDLLFHLRLHSLLNSLSWGHASQKTVQDFIEAEKLTDWNDEFCTALARAVLHGCIGPLSKAQLASLWALVACSPEASKVLHHVTCSMDEAVALITRDGVLVDQPDYTSTDTFFFSLILRLASTDAGRLSDVSVQNLRMWLNKVEEYSAPVEQFVNALIQCGKLIIDNSNALLLWMENRFFAEMKLLASIQPFSGLLDKMEPQLLSKILLKIASSNQELSWTTGVERLLINWFECNKKLPDWNEENCILAARRSVSLEDQEDLWPVLTIRCVEKLGIKSQASIILLHDKRTRMLPRMQPHVSLFRDFVHAHNIEELRNAVRTHDDLLRLSEMWRQISNDAPFELSAEEWRSLLNPFTQALNGLKLAPLITLKQRLQLQDLPVQCLEQLQYAIALQMINCLPSEDLTERTLEELSTLRQQLTLVEDRMTLAVQQRVGMLDFFFEIIKDPMNRDSFVRVRKGVVQLAQPTRQMLNALFGKHATLLFASIFLTNLNVDNSFDWPSVFERLTHVFQLPQVAPNEIPKYKDDNYELFLCLICSLFQEHQPDQAGFLLNSHDRQELSDWLLASSPKLIKRLRAEQKKYGDIPDEIVERLHLSGKRR